ncbi:Regulatory protein BlaI [Sebaldella termitidis]|jgi:BlaI family penicillinase repressor|uniref:Transcriptional repressor, CopY family n=1 Tax=Sebaldella termitidis (strain ATCC 33386 / NCTC 11300) TaxID=526218 RepID=D1AQD2_SEBTE|nr:BlaI/MecI/CopY family transcriptional regulator [Sebaldella termitidis]ACZ10192.1 transcriptional repressor, CopY family [Sebaldella termitidis ATCC 33386]MBP7979055.1 BlaI/MecI/CopY family transcriptional regulator [Sebaldella sp.]SUI25530.1 Regulatory protein BlaI [Sebaldella termitidis]
MKNSFSISEAEYQVMKLIWDKAPVSTKEVTEILTVESSWKPKTIQTLLSRLVKKGAIGYKKEGRVFVYTPLIKEEDYVEQESSSFLNKFYDGALNSMVVNFLEQDKLTENDINELKKILDMEKDKKGK